MTKKNIFGFTIPELRELLAEKGIERYRAEQIFYWLYNRGAEGFEEMTNLSKALRGELAEAFTITPPRIDREQRSSDGTRKFLLVLEDGLKIESVLIPSESAEEGRPKRLTLCVSTQAGCPLDCRFCATASMKLKRNLAPGEITGQYLAIQKVSERRITNLVFMGMGEPLLNYDNVMKSVEIITHEKTCGVSSSHITISTAGLVDGIRRMADEKRKVKLAISLHTADDALRLALMPIHKKYNLDALLGAAEYYYRATRKRITWEYILFDGLNDTPEALNKLIKFIRRVPSKVNIIPFHPIDGVFPAGRSEGLRSTPPHRIEAFAQALREKNVTVMIRSSSGRDIDAACGQLAVKTGKG